MKWVSLLSKIYVTGLIMGTLAWTASLTLVLSFLSLSFTSLLSFCSSLSALWDSDGVFPFPLFSFFFLHCIRYPSACAAGALFLSESQWKAARRSRRTTSNDYMSGNEHK